MKDRHVHFPGLNGLRFFAALAVAVSHVELLKQYLGYPNAYDRPAVYELGRLSVTFFFVLSGFLISYLLLAEKELTGTVSLRAFYLRRILRIWPLYYLLVALAFFVLPRIAPLAIPELTAAIPENLTLTLPLFAFFLPQLALSLAAPVPFAEPAWSIGVEEQFYLLWPLVVKKFRRFGMVIAVVIIATIAARHAALALATANRADAAALRWWNAAISYLYFTRMECMAIGGLGAWIVFRQKRALLFFLSNRFVQVAVYALTAFLMITPAGKPIFDYGWYSVCFAVIIVNVATSPRSLIKLSHPLFDFLGNISFSMYMFHEIAIRIVIASLGVRSSALLYSASLLLTIGIASASYLWFERPFLRLKKRFAVIDSGTTTDGGLKAAAPRLQPS
jgi:peptidoglycan/LPS O-acetylase OafA/YrhL